MFVLNNKKSKKKIYGHLESIRTSKILHVIGMKTIKKLEV